MAAVLDGNAGGVLLERSPGLSGGGGADPVPGDRHHRGDLRARRRPDHGAARVREPDRGAEAP